MNNVHIIAGGTICHIRPHLALCAPAYGSVGDDLFRLCCKYFKDMTVNKQVTRMAGGPSHLETNEDVEKFIDELIIDPNTKVLFMPVALCDFKPISLEAELIGPVFFTKFSDKIGKDYPRLSTSQGNIHITCTPTEKLVSKVRKNRKDIFLIAFKATTNDTEDEMFNAGMNLLKASSCNLVLVNDIKTNVNMILTPEMARYEVTTDRYQALKQLVIMAAKRSSLTYHRTILTKGELIKWDSVLIPNNLRTVVEYCVAHNAYKPFNGTTVGHYGFLVGPDKIISSRRKCNYNNLEGRHMVEVRFENDKQFACQKPSAGVRSQRELFKQSGKFDCVVHFHCPIKTGSNVNIQSQFEFECGSLECGKNTIEGMRQHGDNIAAVMLDKHGPNILFRHDTDPQEVIQFINDNFDLSKSTSE